MNTGRYRFLVLLGFIGLTVTSAMGQTKITSSVIGAGGGRATGSNYGVVGTIGQPVIGLTTGATVSAAQGFWYAYPAPTTVSVREEYSGASAGESLALLQNVPNPFNEWTEIRLQVPARGHVVLRIYDALGRAVRTLIDGEREAGAITLRMESDGLESGRYTAQLVVSGQQRSISLIVVK